MHEQSDEYLMTSPFAIRPLPLVWHVLEQNLLLLDGDELELAQDVLGKPGDLDTAPGGLVRSVEFLVDGVELGKVTHIL
jgi:hypothetical protein